MKKQVFVVSHTHWDREWYLTRETFLMMLVDLVDRLIDIVEHDPDYRVFMLDGQTIVLEDYLSVRPEREEVLKRYIQDGRILIGPWYVLPDEYLISAEGHVRNYLMGSRLCERMGTSMQVGYLPDSFGHPSQMPQILKGLGLEQIVFWRGLGAEVTETELQWTGLDGTKILGINMPYGYGMAACIPTEEELFMERMDSIIERLAPLTRTNSILVMQGVDHVAPLRELPGLLEKARARFPEYEFIHGSLPEYLDSLPQDLPLQETSGELRSGYKAYLLGGTISTRMYVKQENFRRERELLYYAEPLQALSSIVGKAEYQSDVLAHAWKLYLQNMPHDSICGCSIDEVHDEMMLRYGDLETVNAHLISKSVEAIVPHLAWPQEQGDGSLLLFNPQMAGRKDETTLVDILYEKHLIRKVNYSNSVLEENYPELIKPNPTGIEVWAADGKKYQGDLIKITVTDEAMDLSLDTQPQMYLETRIQVAVPVASIPSVGLTALNYRWTYEPVSSDTMAEGSRIENDMVSIEVDTVKSHILFHEKTSESTEPVVLRFIDTGDAGDEYTFSSPEYDQEIQWQVHGVRRLRKATGETLVVEGALELPASITPDRSARSLETLECPLEVELFLPIHKRMVECTVRFDNHVEDHHLVALLDTRRAGTHSFAESLYGVDRREIVEKGSATYSEWVEAPSTYAQKTFVAIPHGTGAVGLANRGIPAFETYRSSEGTSIIALTLLRSVGWLSRYDLRSRKGNGGWSLRTPGAQCKGAHTFEFAVLLEASEVGIEHMAKSAHGYAYPVLGRQVAPGCKGCHPSVELVRVESEAIVLSAIKRAESGEEWVFRCYNTTAEEVDTQLFFHQALATASLGTLAETPGEPLELIDSHGIQVEFAPWQVHTILVKYRGGEC